MNDFFEIGFAVVAAYCLTLSPIALLALAVPYTVIRLRHESPADPQLGAKVVFQFFFSASLLLILAGLTVLMVDELMRPPPEAGYPLGRRTLTSLIDEINPTQRTGVAIILSGAVGVAVHVLCLQATTAAHRHRVRRTFVGWRLAIHGVVLMIALTLLLILILQEGAFRYPLVTAVRAVTGVMLVWLTSWLVHLLLLFDLIRRPPRGETEPTTAGRKEKPAPTIAPPPFVTEAVTLTIVRDEDSDSSETNASELRLDAGPPPPAANRDDAEESRTDAPRST